MKDVLYKSKFGQSRQMAYENALSFVKWKIQAMNGMTEIIKLQHINKSFNGVQFTEKDIK